MEILEIKDRISLMQSRIEELENENFNLQSFLDLFMAWHTEDSSAHRAARLVALLNMHRKLSK